MLVNDPIADMLTRIRNALIARHDTVTMPASNMKKAIAKILLDEGYIKSVDYINDGLQGVSAGDSGPVLPFQNGIAVYHDYFGDYSTNEPTMDGTASMTYYLSTLDKIDDQVKKNDKYAGAVYDEFGAIRRMNPDQKRVYLVFTGDVNFEGVPTVLKTLKKHGIKASWFLTGNCVRTNPKQVKAIMKAGHYIGPHSDKHLLYAEWDADRKSLVTPQEIREDLVANMMCSPG